MDQVEAEVITAIATLLQTEPMDEEGLCPWCGEIRADWARQLRAEHNEACPWRRLEASLLGQPVAVGQPVDAVQDGSRAALAWAGAMGTLTLSGAVGDHEGDIHPSRTRSTR